MPSILALLLLSLLLPCEGEDKHENCQYWADIGECQSNPGYMLVNCAEACAKVRTVSDSSNELPSSFYDIIEKDINGNDLSFEKFRGKVVYAVNVASHCGYTAENYDLFKSLKKYRDSGLEIVLFPCNQFGGQEPGDSKAITKFAKAQGFEGVILSKADVNGPSTRIAFRYLKHATAKSYISWNFDGKFLIDRNGNVHTVNSDVQSQIRELLDVDEL